MSEHSFDKDIAKEYGIEEAILLKNIDYWVEKNEANGKNFYDGCYWTYNSIKAFKEMFPYMSEKKIRNALNKLVENDLIITGCYNSDIRDRTLWYAITEKGKSILPKSNLHFPKRANDIVNNNIYSNNNTNINNTNIIPNSNKENNISKDIFKESPMKTNEKHKYGEYGRVLLTDEQYQKLLKEYDKTFIDDVIEKVDAYVESNNNKNHYSNFYAVIKNAIKGGWFGIKEPIKKGYDTKYDNLKGKNYF